MAHDSTPPWPGFVDALSSVLMMMIFFTLILVLVVATLSYKIGRTNTVASEEASSSSETVNAPSRSATDRLQEALTQKAELSEEDIDPKESAYVLALEKLEEEKALMQKQLQESQARLAQLEESRGKEVKLRSGDDKTPPPVTSRIVKGLDENNRLIILYNQLTSVLEEQNKAEMLKWIGANRGAIDADGISVIATLNIEGVPSSTANNVSFKRLYDLIRIISEEGGVPKSKIKFRALTEAAPGSNQVSISVNTSALP
jgi:hypothetical protein